MNGLLMRRAGHRLGSHIRQAALLLTLAVPCFAGDWANLGPIYDRFRLTLAPGERVEAAGPLFYDERRDSVETWAVPPLMSRSHDEKTDWTEFDFAYPMLSYDRFGAEYRFHILQVLAFAGGGTQGGTNVSRFTLFPFYFQQRSAIPEKNYTALLPIYGTLKDRLLRDEIRFVLMPLWVQSRKKDVVTDNYLYPIFHKRHGNGLTGWQVWPLVGHESKQITFQTNIWGDTLTIPGHESRFALWPIYLESHQGIGSTNPVLYRAVLPLFSMTRSPMRDSTTYFWPFGLTITDDREKQYREWDFPWPLVVFSRGEGKQTSRVFPFYSTLKTPLARSDFYMWPVYRYRRFTSDPLDRERTRILLFLYSDVIERNTESGQSLRRIDFWPFFTARRDFDGNERLQVLSLLEPFIPNNKSIERNYSHVWSLWRSERNALSGAASQSLLWNLYRRETAPQTKKVSLLFGLFQYQSMPEGKRCRVLGIPFGKRRDEPRQPASP